MEQLRFPEVRPIVGAYYPWAGVDATGEGHRVVRRWRRCSSCRVARAAKGDEFCRLCRRRAEAVMARAADPP